MKSIVAAVQKFGRWANGHATFAWAVFAIIVGIGSPTEGSVTSLFNYETWGGTWADADKTWNGQDNNLCWAASASNVLEWTRWGRVPGLATSDQIFQYFQDHWTNQGGDPYYAWDWWFDGTNLSLWAAQVDVPGGGFWTAYNFPDYFRMDYMETTVLQSALRDLSDGYGVTLSVMGPGSHSITCWGVAYDNDPLITDIARVYRGVYVTDSDDGIDGLRYYNVSYSGVAVVPPELRWQTATGISRAWDLWRVGLCQNRRA